MKFYWFCMSGVIFWLWICLLFSSRGNIYGKVGKSFFSEQSAFGPGIFLATGCQAPTFSPSSCTYSLAFLSLNRMQYIEMCSIDSPITLRVDDLFSGGLVDELLIHLATFSLDQKNDLPFALEAPIPGRYLPDALQQRNASLASNPDLFFHSKYPHKLFSLKDLLMHRSGMSDEGFYEALKLVRSPDGLKGGVPSEFCWYNVDVKDTEENSHVRGRDNGVVVASHETTPILGRFLNILFKEVRNSSLQEKINPTAGGRGAAFSPVSLSRSTAKTSPHHSFLTSGSSAFPYSFSRTNIALGRFVLEKVLQELHENTTMPLTSNDSSHRTSTRTISVPSETTLEGYVEREVLRSLNLPNSFFLNCEGKGARPAGTPFEGLLAKIKEEKDTIYSSHFSSRYHHYHQRYHSTTMKSNRSSMASVTPSPCTPACTFQTTGEDLYTLLRESLLPFGVQTGMEKRYRQLFSIPSTSCSASSPFLSASLALSTTSSIEGREEEKEGEQDTLTHGNSEEEDPCFPISRLSRLMLSDDNTSSTIVSCAPVTPPSSNTPISQYVWVAVGVIIVIMASTFVSYLVDHIVHPTPPARPVLPEPDRGFGDPPRFSADLSDTFSSLTSCPSPLSNDSMRMEGRGGGERRDNEDDDCEEGVATSHAGKRQYFREYRTESADEEPDVHSSLRSSASPVREIFSVPPHSSSRRDRSASACSSEKAVYLNMYEK